MKMHQKSKADNFDRVDQPHLCRRRTVRRYFPPLIVCYCVMDGEVSDLEEAIFLFTTMNLVTKKLLEESRHN